MLSSPAIPAQRMHLCVRSAFTLIAARTVLKLVLGKLLFIATRCDPGKKIADVSGVFPNVCTNVKIIATFRVAILTLQTPKLWWLWQRAHGGSRFVWRSGLLGVEGCFGVEVSLGVCVFQGFVLGTELFRLFRFGGCSGLPSCLCGVYSCVEFQD